MTCAPCPQCDRPAEIVDRFSLASTSGPYDHVKIICPGGHWFTLPAEDVEGVPDSVFEAAPAMGRVQPTCDARGAFAVVLTGPPGAGKTVALTALSDALVGDQVEHAAVDVDEVAWSYPFPGLVQRCDHLRAWCDSHRRAGHQVLLVAEVIESPGHLCDVLDALGADEHLLVRLEARLATLRQRIIAREPPGWFGLAYLLDETESLHLSLRELDGVHLVLDTERLGPTEITDRMRSARPEKLSHGARQGAGRVAP